MSTKAPGNNRKLFKIETVQNFSRFSCFSQVLTSLSLLVKLSHYFLNVLETLVIGQSYYWWQIHHYYQVCYVVVLPKHLLYFLITIDWVKYLIFTMKTNILDNILVTEWKSEATPTTPGWVLVVLALDMCVGQHWTTLVPLSKCQCPLHCCPTCHFMHDLLLYSLSY